MRFRLQLCTLTGHSGEVCSVAFSPDGKRAVSGSRDCLVKIWNVETAAEVSNSVGMRYGSRAMVAFCGLSAHPPPHNWSEARLGWQVCSPTGHSQNVFRMGGEVRSVSFSPDGTRIVSTSEWNDGLVKIWDAPTGDQVGSSVGSPTRAGLAPARALSS